MKEKRGETRCSPHYTLESYCRIAAPEVGIDIMCNDPHFQMPFAAQRLAWTAGHIQVFRKNKLDAFYFYILTVLLIMGRYGDGLHAALIFASVVIGFGQNNSESNPFVRADIFQFDIELYDPAGRFQIRISQINDQRVLAFSDCKIDRDRARLRIYRNTAVNLNRRLREGNRISLCIRVKNGLVDREISGSLAGVLHIEFQRCTLVSRDSE